MVRCVVVEPPSASSPYYFALDPTFRAIVHAKRGACVVTSSSSFELLLTNMDCPSPRNSLPLNDHVKPTKFTIVQPDKTPVEQPTSDTASTKSAAPANPEDSALKSLPLEEVQQLSLQLCYLDQSKRAIS